MVGLGAALLSIALVWIFGVAPALKIVRAAPAQLEALDAQLQSITKLAAQAKGLQGRPSLARNDALRALESSLQQRFGANAQLNVSGQRATVTLKGAAPDVLVQWLNQARVGARAIAVQANLTRGTSGWDGSIVFDLPPSP